MPSVAVFAMPEAGHFQRLRPLIAGLARRGADVHVFTDERFARGVEAEGASFVDLFLPTPLAAVDAESLPLPCRYVTFAGACAEEVAARLAQLRPSVVVCDTFAVVGRVAARIVGAPHVNVCAGHNVHPSRFVPMLEADPRASVSAACLEAVEVLRERHGFEDASPFSYVSGLSPVLNVYCEPAAYLTEAERQGFEPVVFYGSLPDVDALAVRPATRDTTFGVYVSFGTVIWRYWSSEAADALRAVAAAIARLPHVRALIGLGTPEPRGGLAEELAAPNVVVAGYVDQWRALREADAFVTHNGLNSTHEAIFNLVPMISYPFFFDQPALAARCRALGLAVPLTEPPRAPVVAEDVERALAEVVERRESLRARLELARGWELDTIAGRGAVVERILAL